jgi:hypothetical protein
LPIFRNMLLIDLLLQVPVCLAGTDTDEFLTAEPAIVVHTETDDIFEDHFSLGGGSAMMTESPDETEWIRQSTLSQTADHPVVERRKTQRGVTLRRAVQPLAARKRTSSMESECFDKLDDDERSGISPFEKSMSCRNFGHGTHENKSFRSRASSGSDADQLRSRRPRSNTANTPPGLIHPPGLIQPVSMRGRRASLLGSVAPQLFTAAKVHNNQFTFDHHHHRPRQVNGRQDEDLSCRSQLSGTIEAQEEDLVESDASHSKHQ